jgi:hypothetical protein
MRRSVIRSAAVRVSALKESAPRLAPVAPHLAAALPSQHQLYVAELVPLCQIRSVAAREARSTMATLTQLKDTLCHELALPTNRVKHVAQWSTPDQTGGRGQRGR